MEIKITENLNIKSNGENSRMQFVLSSDNVDRDFERVMVDGLSIKNFLNNPVMYFMHASYNGFNIGKWENIKKKKIDGINYLFATPVFNELDDESMKVKKFVDAGELNMSSIGFLPTSIEKIAPPKEYEEVVKLWNYDGLMRVIKKAELLEASIVGIGSNPDALRQKVSKGLITNITEKDIAWLKEKTFNPHLVYYFLHNKSLLNKQTKLFEEPTQTAIQTAENSDSMDYTTMKEIFNYDKINVQFIEEKQGAVLSKKNKAKLQQATELINDVLTSSEPEPEEEQVPYYENEPKNEEPQKEKILNEQEILSILN